MTVVNTLFGLIPAASRGEQWVAQNLQLVNWGGYCDYQLVRFAPDATLLCGSSGAGKSTLMDAYIALLMPHTTPFNGASNGAVVGRPRGKDQRNILSYARGKLDETRTDGETRVRVLRGDGCDTWSAVAMTWLDHTGRQFTALRAWYVPATARSLDEVVVVRASCDQEFRLSDLAVAVSKRLSRAAVTATGLTCFDTDRDFTARLYSTLGIGAAGEGHQAVSLLGRIQSGQQITTVDALYKTMVLEEPSTLALADEVVQHFDELRDTRTKMATARQQVDALAPIRKYRSAIDDASTRLCLLDEIGQFTDASSPAALWTNSRRLELLRAVEERLSREYRTAQDRLADTETAARTAQEQHDDAAEALRRSGGDQLAMALRSQAQAEQDLAQAEQERNRLAQVLAPIGGTVSTEAEFAALVEVAQDAQTDTAARSSVRDDYAEAKGAFNSATEALARLEKEQHEASQHKDNIPPDLRAARAALAKAAGLSPNALPFVCELIDVQPEFEPWREAFNLALGGFATRLLLDKGQLAQFREAINEVVIARRIQFLAVPTGQRFQVELHAKTLPGRLTYRTSPFREWLQSQLESNFNFTCVDVPKLLAQYDKALTITGQTAEPGRGAHGGQGRANVLGFSNTTRLAGLAEQIGEAKATREKTKAELSLAVAAHDSFDAKVTSYAAFLQFSWPDVDVLTLGRNKNHWDKILTEIQSENPQIAELQRQVNEYRQAATKLHQAVGAQGQAAAQLGAGWQAKVTEVDRAQSAQEAAEQAGGAVTAEQEEFLTDLFANFTATDAAEALAEFKHAVTRAADQLRGQRSAAEEKIENATGALQAAFSNFVQRWPNPNLSCHPMESYGDFDRLLAELEGSRLHELEIEWRNSLLKLSGDDLTALDYELGGAVRRIQERIDPVNRILADLSFSDDKHRLQIDPQKIESRTRAQFQRKMREVRAAIQDATSDADRELAYKLMEQVIKPIRRSEPTFADLVDVRNHVRISAEKQDLDGQHVAVYDHIGEKSGGESQELVAFIVGAALRYQLGDAGATRPRYAPVFLDEALIKADAHFTGRAMGAWRGLGFQLIVGAPNDKYSAIEPHVSAQYLIYKSAEGRSWAKLLVGLDQE